MINRKYIICAAINDSGRTVSRMVTIKSFFTKMSLHMALDFVRHTTDKALVEYKNEENFDA